MSVVTVLSLHHIAPQFTVPSNGAVRWQVDSEFPVTVFAVDAPNLIKYRASQPYQSYGNSQGQHHAQSVHLPFQGPWYLVVANYGTANSAVNFLVWS